MKTPPQCGEFKQALSTTNEAGQGNPRICGISATSGETGIQLTKMQ
jgi:hypothetical protein